METLHPEVVKALKKLTPAQRVAMAFEANQLVRARLRAYLSDIHPDWSEDQIQREIARRVLHGTD